MEPGYQKMLVTLLDLQAASVTAVLTTASHCLLAARQKQEVDGYYRVGLLTLLSDLDHARGPRSDD